MAELRITKRLVDALEITGREYFVWDADLPGFGLRVRGSGAKTYVVQYRAGSGRVAPSKRFTLGRTDRLAPDEARAMARKALASVTQGGDPAKERAERRGRLTVAEIAAEFLSKHVALRRKPRTRGLYDGHLTNLILPELGKKKATDVTAADVARLHQKIGETRQPAANRMLITLSALYRFAAKRGYVPESFNPAKGIERFREQPRERYLSLEELQRLGATLLAAETFGLPWTVDDKRPTARHTPKADPRTGARRTLVDRHAVAAIRLLLFTGCRLREVLHLKWREVDFERGLLFLQETKTGPKTLVLNAPALEVLQSLPRLGDFVIPGRDPDKPRADLKRPWDAIIRHAGVENFRLHDLRHSFASVGVGSGLGLPIIGKLLGHAQMETTERYAHLDADPLRRASNKIASILANALGQTTGPPPRPSAGPRSPGAGAPGAGEVVPLRSRKRR